MNKKVSVAIIIILLIALFGGLCIYTNNSEKESETTENESLNDTTTNINNETKNILILYFSATNNTEIVAKYISEVTDGDLIEIIPKDEYTSDDLNYSDSNSRANQEQNDDSARPEISNTNIDITHYDTIYLGYPIWWGDVPKIILTVLDTYDFSDKTVIPFCTSGSSGIESSVHTLRNYNENINFLDGKRFSSSSTIEDIESWINES